MSLTSQLIVLLVQKIGTMISHIQANSNIYTIEKTKNILDVPKKSLYSLTEELLSSLSDVRWSRTKAARPDPTRLVAHYRHDKFVCNIKAMSESKSNRISGGPTQSNLERLAYLIKHKPFKKFLKNTRRTSE